MAINITAIGISFIWSFITGAVFYLLLRNALGKTVRPIITIAIVTFGTFAIELFFDIGLGLGYILNTAIVSVLQGTYTVDTLGFMFAAAMLMFLVASATFNIIWNTVQNGSTK